jgi:hypothetical protein
VNVISLEIVVVEEADSLIQLAGSTRQDVIARFAALLGVSTTDDSPENGIKCRN